MSADVVEHISRKVRLLPKAQQEQVRDFVDSLCSPPRTLLDVVRDIESEIPDEIFEKLPTDGAHNHDHYLYGAPKK